jgi:hypothetical protein
MSRAYTWKQAIWESDLKATTKLVLQALASHLNDFGDAMFPSQARLSKLCSLSERAIIEHLQIAEREGWIAPRRRGLAGSKWAANEYVAQWPDGVKYVQPRGEPRSPHGVNQVHTELSTRNTPCEEDTEPEKNVTRVPREGEVSITDFAKTLPCDDGIPKVWIEAGTARGLTEARAIRQAAKCIWYFSKGKGAGVLGTPDWWQKQAWRFMGERSIGRAA